MSSIEIGNGVFIKTELGKDTRVRHLECCSVGVTVTPPVNNVYPGLARRHGIHNVISPVKIRRILVHHKPATPGQGALFRSCEAHSMTFSCERDRRFIPRDGHNNFARGHSLLQRCHIVGEHPHLRPEFLHQGIGFVDVISGQRLADIDTRQNSHAVPGIRSAIDHGDPAFITGIEQHLPGFGLTLKINKIRTISNRGCTPVKGHKPLASVIISPGQVNQVRKKIAVVCETAFIHPLEHT